MESWTRPGRAFEDSCSALRFPTSGRLKLSRVPPLFRSCLVRCTSVLTICHPSSSLTTGRRVIGQFSLFLFFSRSRAPTLGFRDIDIPTHCNHHQCNSSQVIPAHRTEPSPLIMPYLHMHIHHHHHFAFCHHFFCRAGRRFAGGTERRNSTCRLCSNRYDHTYISVCAIRTGRRSRI